MLIVGCIIYYEMIVKSSRPSSISSSLTRNPHVPSHALYRCSQYNRGLDKVGGALLFKLLLDFYHDIEATPSATTSTTLPSATMGNSSTLDANYASQSPPSIRDGCNTNTMESPRKVVRQSSKKKARFKDSGIMDDAYLLCDDDSCAIAISSHLMSSHGVCRESTSDSYPDEVDRQHTIHGTELLFIPSIAILSDPLIMHHVLTISG